MLLADDVIDLVPHTSYEIGYKTVFTTKASPLHHELPK